MPTSFSPLFVLLRAIPFTAKRGFKKFSRHIRQPDIIAIAEY